MTEHDQAPASTSAVAHRFETLAEALAVALLTADADAHVDYVNPAARELFWRSDEELKAEGWLRGIHSDERQRVSNASLEVCRSGNAARADFRIDVAGYTRWVRARFNALPLGRDGRCGWVAMFEDVTAERATSDELARRAAHDQLTGLPNRTLLHDRLDHAIARAQRTDAPITVIFMDLDGFKEVNDRLGHHVGDEVLREVARRLLHAIRSEDTAARLGGDEFVVVAEGIDREVASAVAERLARTVDGAISAGGEEIHLAMSIGVAWDYPPGRSASAMVADADRAMYEAKRTGVGVAFADDVSEAL